MLPLLGVPAIALVAARAPAWLQPRAPGTVWCRTTAEVLVLAQQRALRAVVLDRAVPGVDAHLIGALRRTCPVLVIGAPGRSWWSAAGAAAVPALPDGPSALEAAVLRAEAHHHQTPGASGAGPGRGALVAVVGAAGSRAVDASETIARSFAGVPQAAPVVLADLTLDAPHRARHRLSRRSPGLPELVAASRFGPLTDADVAAALHPVAGGHRVLPGLHTHADWVSVGPQAAETVLTAVRARATTVVAHVDPDLEGEAETGSFDIEDRNALARTSVAAADLVLVVPARGQTARTGADAVLAALSRFGTAPERIAVISGHRWLVGPAVRTLLARKRASAPAEAAAPVSHQEPRRIVPGTLGHWAQDIDGWITPSVPQQP